MIVFGAALVVITSTETIIAGNFRNSRQAFYAAEAAAELAVADLRSRTNWIGVVEGTERSQFIDGAPGGVRALPTDAPVDLTAIVNIANCNAPAPCGGVARWQLFAYGPLRDLAPPGASDSPFYIVAFVSGGQTESGAPLVTIRAEAFGPKGAYQALGSPSPERTMAKRSSCGASSLESFLPGLLPEVTKRRRSTSSVASAAPRLRLLVANKSVTYSS
jgi:hypothetical protein